MNALSGFLYAQPTFIEGVGRIFDFGGLLNTYNSSESPDEADEMALNTDWLAVCEDLQRALAQFKQDHPELEADAPTR